MKFNTYKACYALGIALTAGAYNFYYLDKDLGCILVMLGLSLIIYGSMEEK